MKVLGIDTSGNANVVGIVDGTRVLADCTFETQADSLGKIISNIDFTLKKAGLLLEDIEGFGVGLGPGSWTGIRIGVTVGKILAYSTDKPIYGVSTLEALAYHNFSPSLQVCPVINAGIRDTVYAALYEGNHDSMTRVGEYYAGNIHNLAEIIKKPTVFVGADIQLYRKIIRRSIASPDLAIKMVAARPEGAIIALLAARRLESGESDNPLNLAPLYLKESTARAFVNKYRKGTQVKDEGS
jgi:tRNA threonylcarbamoyladenosine biosynthesis protein TsaB